MAWGGSLASPQAETLKETAWLEEVHQCIHLGERKGTFEGGEKRHLRRLPSPRPRDPGTRHTSALPHQALHPVPCLVP